ncbi:hypothetical protein SBOR_1590 [Sclerotinia borealis F-4128]|uniref:PHD-type domain-containing protein n=1 Tax=Sclerotinia borealis (strain F-4128) TaxID=1432307 RepID=W9CTZ7_SCLBF|nr:hypothetical protein SBOR_1590 [Sclerotinia borealis F-4128]
MSWEHQTSYEGSDRGWTPQFAEDYSMFNTTPGRLVNGQRPFVDTSTVQALSCFNQNAQFHVEDMVTDLGMHMYQLSPDPALAISPATSPNKQVSSTTAPQSVSRARFSDVFKTPLKPNKRLDAPFCAQNATTPQSAGKGTRKLDPKIFTIPHNAQAQSNGFEAPNTNNHHLQLMAQSSISMDPFVYPMSAPASTPFYASNKAMWDASMDGMDLDFWTDSAGIFHKGHRPSNASDWERGSQMFQESMNSPPQKSTEPKAEPEPRKRHRPRASKSSFPTTSALPTSPPFLAFSSATVTPNSIAMEGFPSAVNPDLICTRPNTGNMFQGEYEDIIKPAPRVATATSPIRNLEVQPYQHQIREYTREQEELRRSPSFRESSLGYRAASSPVKGSARPGLKRSISESRDELNQELRRFNSERLSPTKQQRQPSLTSIPESPVTLPKLRRDVKLAVGSNGRATVVIDEPAKKLRRSSSQVIDYESGYDTSDDEPIIITSRNNSFKLPQQKPLKFGLFDTSSTDFQRPSTSTSGYSRSTGQHTSIDEMSEAETVFDKVKTGDAASALRKVVRERRSNQQMPKNGRYQSMVTPRAGRYAEYTSSSNNSPDGTTPSSSRSGDIRCVCRTTVDDSPLSIQCDSCEYWLHGECVDLPPYPMPLPEIYICPFCAQMPKMRNDCMRESGRDKRNLPSSPLAHKSFRSFRR